LFVDTIAIAGVGLIGGSFALAMRSAGFNGRIVGVSSPRAVEAAISRGAIDEALPLEEAVAVADLVYLSQPIAQILRTLDQIGPHVKPGALITDAGSTKRAICARSSKAIQTARFVGGHPMAGKESRGVEHADADLFRGRPYVLTSRDEVLEGWIEKIGARLVFMSPATHDRVVAMVSHLPQMLSTALGSVLANEPRAAEVAGPGAQDMTRLALSSYDIWHDILATNAEPVEAALDLYIAKLEELRTSLRSPEMQKEFERAASAAKALRQS
jgi:prephenate dehydrogenase